MWNERRMTSGPRQTKAGAASCPLDAIGEDRPGPWCAPVVSTGGRAGRRASSDPLRGITSIPARMSSATRTWDESRPGRESRWRAMPERTETGRAAPSEGRNTTEIPIVEEHSSQRPTLWSGLRPRTGGGTPRAIARIEVRAIGSAMWLVRCRCRRRPQRIRAPALVESRPSRSRELVPESSLPVRPSNLAGG